MEDDATFCLLNLMLLFATDSSSSSSSSSASPSSSSAAASASAHALEDRAAAHAHQLRFTRLLEKYLRSRHGRLEATRRFADAAAALIPLCREIGGGGGGGGGGEEDK